MIIVIDRSICFDYFISTFLKGSVTILDCEIRLLCFVLSQQAYEMELANEIPSESRASSPSGQKKVEFDLSATSMQDFYEYRRKVKRGKYPNPFDASKKPTQGVLKYTTPSPINPFYKKAYNINYWTPAVSTIQLIEQMEMESADNEI